MRFSFLSLVLLAFYGADAWRTTSLVTLFCSDSTATITDHDCIVGSFEEQLPLTQTADVLIGHGCNDLLVGASTSHKRGK